MSIIKRQAIISTFFSYGGAALGIITQGFLIPNYFSLEENGLLALLLSWMSVLCQFASLGFNHAGIKFFDKFRNYEENHNGYLGLGILINLLGFTTCLLIGFLFKDILMESDKADQIFIQKYIFILVPISFATLIFNIFDNYARGLYDTIFGSFLSQFLQRFILLVAVVIYAFGGISFEIFIYCWMLAFVIPAILMVFKAISLGSFSISINWEFWNSKIRKPFFQFAFFSVITGLSSMVILHLDKIMVNEYLGLASTGIYNTCLLFSSLLGLVYMAVNKASSALVLDFMAIKAIEKVNSVYKKSSMTMTIFGLVLFLCVVVNIDDLFSFIRPEYSAGKTALIIIGFSKIYDLMNGINGLILANSEYYKKDALLMISFVAVLYCLNIFLIPNYGLNGAAMAVLFAVFYYNSMRTYLVYRYFSIHPFSNKMLIVFMIFFILVLIGRIMPSFDVRIISITYKSIILTAMYVGAVYIFKLSPQVNELLDQLRHKIFRIND